MTRSRESKPAEHQMRPGGMPEKLAYSVPGAAEALSLSVDYVWKLVAMGELPSVKIGKRRLIEADKLRAFLKDR
ncbi:helix-turn-helix domain-containing protein [Mesorhizobium sp.]|uniref:helix-turn-helix domain-containing protein n=1 Tax=Mesorhizobium sp. TaxID=1871066 RepID=UPI0025BF5225|nr:helix-turn-helix domain-containing protein [Mesorhizobium sp.]